MTGYLFNLVLGNLKKPQLFIEGKKRFLNIRVVKETSFILIDTNYWSANCTLIFLFDFFMLKENVID